MLYNLFEWGFRYPNDTIDRFWWRIADERTNVMQTARDVGVNNMLDYPPMAVMQTSFIATDITVDIAKASNVLTTSTTSHCSSQRSIHKSMLLDNE